MRLRKTLEEQMGYSLVEVLVSIVLLSIAIIPMVAMFDTGLKSATTGSNYDKARSLVNKQLERAKSLSYPNARSQFPGTTTTTYNSSGVVTINDNVDPDPEYSAFRYDVKKEYVKPTLKTGSTDTMYFASSATDQGMVRITVTAKWGGGSFNDKSYSAAGTVAK